MMGLCKVVHTKTHKVVNVLIRSFQTLSSTWTSFIEMLLICTSCSAPSATRGRCDLHVSSCSDVTSQTGRWRKRHLWLFLYEDDLWWVKMCFSFSFLLLFFLVFLTSFHPFFPFVLDFSYFLILFPFLVLPSFLMLSSWSKSCKSGDWVHYDFFPLCVSCVCPAISSFNLSWL